MRKFVRAALLGLALSASTLPVGGPAAAGDCRGRAVDLLRADAPNGLAIYRQIRDKAFFETWIDCADPQYGLPTAVHESVHLITGDDDAYPLVGGGTVRRPPEGSVPFAPARIARQFRSSLFVATYLRPGGASSAGDFRYLLDELNAYTHDLDTAIALGIQADGETRSAHRDGLAALMSFVGLSIEAAGADAAAWKGLNRPDTLAAVSALCGQAERTMAASCPIPGIGLEDSSFLIKLCAAGPQAALGRLLGRAPVCPKACLGGMPRTASRE